MKAYLLANVRVTDPAGFEAYRAAVAPMVTEFGGRYLIRGGASEVVEGAPDVHRIVLLEFADMPALRRFYFSPEYAPVKAMREAAAVTEVTLIEGA